MEGDEGEGRGRGGGRGGGDENEMSENQKSQLPLQFSIFQYLVFFNFPSFSIF